MMKKPDGFTALYKKETNFFDIMVSDAEEPEMLIVSDLDKNPFSMKLCYLGEFIKDLLRIEEKYRESLEYKDRWPT